MHVSCRPVLEENADDADSGIRNDRDGEGRADGIQPEQEKTGRRSAQYRSKRVESIQKRQVISQVLRVMGQKPGQHGQRSSHQGRWNDQRNDGKENAYERKIERRIIPPPGKGNINRRIEVHQPDKDDGEKSDPELEQTVEPQRLLDGIHILPDHIPADCETGHEDGKDRRYSQVGPAKNEGQ